MNPDPTGLDRLHDIIVPAAVPWWPPAPAWYGVMGFAFVFLVVVFVKGFSHWQRNRYRREALAEWNRLQKDAKDPRQRATHLLSFSELLKRTALTAFPREQVAPLTGAAWFAWLDRTAKGATFSAGLGARWQTALYDPASAASLEESTVEEVRGQIRHWILHHQVPVENSSLPKPC